MKTMPICTYCGKKWPKITGDVGDVPKEMQQEIANHMKICLQNPMVKEIAYLKQLLREAQPHICSLLCPTRWITGKRPPEHELCQKIKDILQQNPTPEQETK